MALKNNYTKELIMKKKSILKTPTRVTESELAEYWQVKENTLRKWRSDGRGPAYLKIKGRVIYRKKDIQQFENTRKYLATDQKIQQ